MSFKKNVLNRSLLYNAELENCSFINCFGNFSILNGGDFSADTLKIGIKNVTEDFYTPLQDNYIISDNDNTLTLVNKNFPSTEGSSLVFKGSYFDYGTNYIGDHSKIHSFSDGIFGGGLIFSTSDSDFYYNRLQINRNGNIGINNTNPTSKLHLIGSIKTEGDFNFNNTESHCIGSGNSIDIRGKNSCVLRSNVSSLFPNIGSKISLSNTSINLDVTAGDIEMNCVGITNILSTDINLGGTIINLGAPDINLLAGTLLSLTSTGLTSVSGTTNTITCSTLNNIIGPITTIASGDINLLGGALVTITAVAGLISLVIPTGGEILLDASFLNLISGLGGINFNANGIGPLAFIKFSGNYTKFENDILQQSPYKSQINEIESTQIKSTDIFADSIHNKSLAPLAINTGIYNLNITGSVMTESCGVLQVFPHETNLDKLISATVNSTNNNCTNLDAFNGLIYNLKATNEMDMNPRVIDDNGFIYHLQTPIFTNPNPTSDVILNDNLASLILCRQGTSGLAFGSKCEFQLSRYENVSVNSRTQLIINLSHDSFDSNVCLRLKSNKELSTGSLILDTSASIGTNLTVSGDTTTHNTIQNSGYNINASSITYTNSALIDLNYSVVYIGSNVVGFILQLPGGIAVGQKILVCYISGTGNCTLDIAHFVNIPSFPMNLGVAIELIYSPNGWINF